MLTIRKEQLKTIRDYNIKNFESRMVKHIARIFPEKYQKMGKEGALVIIYEGIEKSSRYGVKSERDVALFIDLMIGIGHDFDIIEEKAWIHDILDDTELPPSDRMDLIYKQLPHRMS